MTINILKRREVLSRRFREHWRVSYTRQSLAPLPMLRTPQATNARPDLPTLGTGPGTRRSYRHARERQPIHVPRMALS